jgi:hypothetical protein
MVIEARMAIMTITIASSINVKPREFVFIVNFTVL